MDQIYDPSGTAAMVSAALNEGRGCVIYTGHGSTTSWGSTGFSNTHVNQLTNDSMLPFITSVACVNGNFDGPLCFGEAWLRATNGTAPTGAIGFYGSSINQSWDPPMEAQDEFTNCYCEGGYVCFGTLCFAGSCSMMDVYGSGGVDMFLTWHLFGDPSVRVVGTKLIVDVRSRRRAAYWGAITVVQVIVNPPFLYGLIDMSRSRRSSETRPRLLREATPEPLYSPKNFLRVSDCSTWASDGVAVAKRKNVAARAWDIQRITCPRSV